MKNKNLFNRKDLKSFRTSLRNRSTSAEAALWEMLKSRKPEGRKFRRQYSIGSYIIVFCCPSEKLVIELDGNPYGEYHKLAERWCVHNIMTSNAQARVWQPFPATVPALPNTCFFAASQILIILLLK